MPRIETRTVAEHHDLHHTRLLDAAVAALVDHDLEALTLAGLAKRAGRSRASLYAYFGSADDLRAAVCERVLGSWVDEVLSEIRKQSSPDERLDRFVTVQIERTHGIAIDRVLSFVANQQGDPLRTRLRALTDPLTDELHAIVRAFGVEPPTRAATVVQGAVAAAYDQVLAGADPAEVADDTLAFVRAGIAALRGSDRERGDGVSKPGAPGVGRGGPLGHPPDSPDSPGAAMPGASAPRTASAPLRRNPSSLARTEARTLPSFLAVVVSEAASGPLVDRRLPARRVARVTALPLVWTVVGFVSGTTGLGGSWLHLLLGLSLIAMLARAARLVSPADIASVGLRALALLALVASAVALVARAEDLESIVAVHVGLAAALLGGLMWLAVGSERRVC